MNKRFAVLGLASVASVPSFAAVPAAVTTAIETGQTDALAVGALVLAAIIGIFALKLMRRAL